MTYGWISIDFFVKPDDPKVTKIKVKKIFFEKNRPPGHIKIAILGHLHRVLPVYPKKSAKNRPRAIFF